MQCQHLSLFVAQQCHTRGPFTRYARSGPVMAAVPGGCAAGNRGADYVEHRDYVAA